MSEQIGPDHLVIGTRPLYSDGAQAQSSASPSKLEGQASIDVPGCEHSCIKLGCTVRSCLDYRNYLIAQGRITQVGDDQFQSNIDFAFDELDPKALAHVAQILAKGQRVYGHNAWMKMSPRHHINHAISHLYAQLDGDVSESHLGNSVCRAIFALAVFLRTDDNEEGVK